jgi:hypothetical protein
MAAAARARQLEGEARERLLDTARGLLEKFRTWASRCESNFGHRRDLIAAEILHTSGEDAADAFEKAVAAAENRGWPHDLALAHELAAEYRAAGGDPTGAQAHARQAADCYTRWGAHAKADDVRERAGLASKRASRN